MKREILFRGKRIDNGEWDYGYFVKYKPYASEDKIVYGIVPTYVSELYLFEVDPETVGQYTGLYDKNDLKIFEGDIVKLHNELGEYPLPVIYRAGSFWLYDKTIINGDYPDDENAGLDLLGSYITDVLEVIGNIHDNPELLEVKQNDD